MNKLLQHLVKQVAETIDAEFGIADETGRVLACTDESKVEQTLPGLQEAVGVEEQSGRIDTFCFYKVFNKNNLEYILFLNSCEEDDALKYLSLISLNVINMRMYYEEKHDRVNFLKNILLGRILPDEILKRSKELHIPYNANRAVLLVKTERSSSIHALEVIQGLFPNRTKDSTVLIDDESIVLVRELRSSDSSEELEKAAYTIMDTLNSELMVKVFVAAGTVADNLKDIYRSYEEAKVALHIGGIFDSDKRFFNYNRLGIGRLIYQLPKDLCQLFLKEVFKDDSLDFLDAETMNTIQSFFENSLNVSETSRKLYVHRNTLVYRLDKIQKITGLDLRKFDDAIIFKVAILVKKYLASRER